MTTKNLVPRADGEGKLGLKGENNLNWKEINAVSGSFTKLVSNELVNQSGNDLIVAGTNVTVTLANDQYTIAASGGGAVDNIFEGNAKVETVDTGSDGHIDFYSEISNNTTTFPSPDYTVPVPVWSITQSGHIIPGKNATFDIGEAENKVRHLFLSDNSLHIGTTSTVEADWLSGGDDVYKLSKSGSNLVWSANGTNNNIVFQSALDSYQPIDPALTSISGLTTAADKLIYTTGTDTYAVADLTSAGRALLDDADAAAQRATLGLGTAATSNSGDFLGSVLDDTTPQIGGNLDVGDNGSGGSFDIVSSSNKNISVAPHGTGKFTVKGNATGGSGSITLNCEDNSHGVTIKSPDHASEASYTLTLPDNDGNPDDVLKTDGSGVLSWVAQSGGGGGGYSVDLNPQTITSSTTSPVTLNAPSVSHEYYIIDNGTSNITINLVSASTPVGEFFYTFKVLGTGTITLSPSTGEYIDYSGQTSYTPAQYDATTIICDGSNWYLI